MWQKVTYVSKNVDMRCWCIYEKRREEKKRDDKIREE